MSTVFLLPQKWERTGFYATMIAWNINQKNQNHFAIEILRNDLAIFILEVTQQRLSSFSQKHIHSLFYCVYPC